MNFSEKQEKELIKILSNSFDNAQTFNEHKKQNKMPKTRKQHETFAGTDFNIDYVLEFTEWAGDNETPPSTECQITEAYLIDEDRQFEAVKLSDGFIESFLEPKLLKY